MPSVPTYKGPQVRGQSLEGGFQQAPGSSDAFGGVAARQIGQLGQAAGKVSEDFDRIALRKETDDAFRVETAVQKEWEKHSTELRKNRAGKNAEGLDKDVAQWWADARQRHGGAVSARGKELIGRSLGRIEAGESRRMGAWQEQELNRSFTDSVTANMGAEIQRYAANGDPTAVGGAREIIDRNMTLLGGRLGWTPEKTAMEKLRYTDIMHRQMIDTLLDQNPAAAKEYLANNKDELDAGTRNKLNNQVNAAFAEDAGRKLADELAALPFEERLAKAAAVTDPDVSKAARKFIREGEQDLQIARAAQEKRVSDEVWQMVGQGVPMGKLPQALLGKMDGRERAKELTAHYAAQRALAVANAEKRAIKTDWELYARMRELPPEDFKKLRLSTFVDKIGGPQMEQLLDLQGSYNKPDSEGRAATRTQVLGAFLSENKLKDEEKGRFQGQFYQEVDQFKAANKREPSPQEERGLMDELMKDVVTRKGWIFTSRETAFKLPASERGGVAAPVQAAPNEVRRPPGTVSSGGISVVIPSADRAEVRAKLKAQGMPETEHNIQLLYQAANK
jgi:hypothetical protein